MSNIGEERRLEALYLQELKDHASEVREFLKNPAKPEREKSVVRAFLKTIGVVFAEPELIAPAEEPADVAFRDCRFQI